MSTRTITALLTTYNCERFIKATIDSILSQTFSDFDFLIIDDGSSDDTCKLIRQYNDPRITLITHDENKGVGYRLNEALDLIQTPYIVKVDGDDLSLPTRFVEQLSYLQSHPNVALVKCYIEYFTTDPQVERSDRFRQFQEEKAPLLNSINTIEKIREELLRWCCVTHSTYFARSDVIKQLGYAERRMGEDYDLFYRAIKAGFDIGCVPKCLLKVRLSDSSTTTLNSSTDAFANMLVELKLAEIEKIVDKHGALYLYGRGQLSKALAKCFAARGYPINGFIDKTAGRETIEDTTLCVFEHSPTQYGGVIIAAQPVREKVRKSLSCAGWREWDDFLVIA